MIRLLNYLCLLKIRQLGALAENRGSSEISPRLDKLFNKEEQLLASADWQPLQTSYEQACLSYYLFLQGRLVEAMQAEKISMKTALISQKLQEMI